MRMRSSDPEDTAEGFRRQRTVHFGREVSIADILAVVSAIGSILYAGSYLSAKVQQNERDIAEFKQWMTAHNQLELQKSQFLDDRLQRIEEKVDVLIGEVDGGPHKPHH